MKNERLLSLDDVRHSILSEETPVIRAAAEFVTDFSEKGQPHDLPREVPGREPRQAFVHIPEGVVLGSVFIRTRDGLLMPRTCAQHPREGFLNYIKTSSTPEAPNDFDSGIRFDGDDYYFEALQEERIEDNVLFVTPDERENYGMWLLQTLPALVCATRIGFSGRVLCRVELPWQRRFIEHFAPALAGNIIPQKPGVAYRADNVFALAQDYRNFTLTAFEKSVFREVVKRAGSGQGGAERLYVARLSHSAKHPHYRVLLNEAELAARLQEQGFMVVEPERLGFDEQIRTFASAKFVAGLGGAGMFSCIFCQSETKVVTIESSSGWISAHANLFAFSGLPYGVIFAKSPPTRLHISAGRCRSARQSTRCCNSRVATW